MNIPAHRTDTPDRSEAEQRAFFDAVLARALTAEARVGARVHCYDLDGVNIRIVFAGPELEQVLTDALAHLEIVDDPDRDADATFHVWDSASTGVEMAPPPCGQECFTERGDIWGMRAGRTRVAFHWSEFAVALAQQDLRCCVHWVADAGSIPYWGRASPLRTLFHWVMQWHGRHLLHAASVGTEDGGILITGKGGVGKSTTALACLADGMRYVADDYLIVALDPPRAISLYATAKLNPDQVRRFPALRPLVTNDDALDNEKAMLQLYPSHGELIARRLELRAVATPEITGDPVTGFAAVDPARLRHAAAFTTITQLPHAGHDSHLFIDRLVATLPNRTLRLGTDLPGIAAAIRAWLAHPVLPAQCAPPRRRPSVSVIIPVYNGTSFLAEAVASIAAQGWEPLELIIVDDGSDDADALAEAIAALPIEARFFARNHAGPADARNFGIRNATGELLAFLDVDDLWPDGRLQVMADLLLGDPSIDVVQGHVQLFRQDALNGAPAYLGNPGESFPYSIAAGLYRREVFGRVGLFDPELWFSEDTDWFARARECGLSVARPAMTTLLARRHPGNMTRGKTHVEVNKLRVFKKFLDRRRTAEASD